MCDGAISGNAGGRGRRQICARNDTADSRAQCLFAELTPRLSAFAPAASAAARVLTHRRRCLRCGFRADPAAEAALFQAGAPLARALGPGDLRGGHRFAKPHPSVNAGARRLRINDDAWA